MNNDEKLNWKQIVSAIGILVVLVGVSYLAYSALFNDKTPKIDEQVNVSKIKGYGKTPQESVAKFITSSGTIGDPNKVTIEALLNKSAIKMNAKYRIDSYNDSLPGLAEKSPIAINDNELFISRYGAQAQVPEFFSVRDVKVSKPSKEYLLTNEKLANGTAKAVDVQASFISTYTYFRQKTFDSSSDGTYVRFENNERFDNVKFTLIKLSDTDWRIFSIDENAKIGSRFAVWNTQGNNYIDHSKDMMVSELKPKEKISK